MVLKLDSNNTIPDDLWVNIFKRLPVKYLYQVRRVCRWWNSLVSSPFFRTLYLNNNNSSAPAIVLGVHRARTFSPDLQPYCVKYGGSEGKLLCLRRQSSKPPVQQVKSIDVIHGVICIFYTWESSYISATLWNPSIRKYVSVPWSPSIVENRNFCVLCNVRGFGFDSANLDFKVVTLFRYGSLLSSYNYGGREPQFYEVFSVQGSMWRKPIQYSNGWNIGWSYDHDPGLFTNGAIHWVTDERMTDERTNNVTSSSTYDHQLVLFDCERDEFKTMELPQEVARKRNSPTLKVLTYGSDHRSCFSLLDFSGEGVLDVWAMEEYGVATSWRKMFSIDDYQLVRYKGSVSFVIQPNLLLMDVRGARDTKLGQKFLLEDARSDDDDASVLWIKLRESAVCYMF